MAVHHGSGSNWADGRVIDAEQGSGRHRRQAAVRRRRQLIAGAATVAVVGALVIAGWLLTTRREHSAPPLTAAPTVEPAAAEWIRGNLPSDTRLLTDGPSPPPDYTATPISASGIDVRNFDYLLTSPRSDPPPDAAVAPVWQHSIPVAVFEKVQVRRIERTPADAILRSREADRADRLTAGTALLENPGMVIAPQPEAILAAGGLDLRAAATLTAIAGATAVNLTDIEHISAEAAAGMPARSLAVQVADVGKANVVLSGLTVAFRPDRVVAAGDGVMRLHWPLSVAPLPSIK